jgi:hypothetical protein
MARAELSQYVILACVHNSPVHRLICILVVVSHSPNLTALPASLGTSNYLSKLTFSHCPSIKAESLPDLSSLPLLRDVKMNNLPYLSSLPPHLATWGTGDLSLVKPSEDSSSIIKRGDGLEVLDLGNCSLKDTALSLFIPPSNTPSTKSKGPLAARWPHLRSLSLHSNPLTTTTPEYATLLQSSTDVPSLQIIDARRVVERKRKGESVVSKLERRANERKEKRAKPSGANVGSMGKVRAWGVGETGDGTEPVAVVEKATGQDKKRKVEGEEKKEKKRKRHHEDVPVDAATAPQRATKSKAEAKVKADDQATSSVPVLPAGERISKKSKPLGAGQPSQPVPVDPSTLPADTQRKPKKSETAVVGVIEVPKEASGKKGKSGKRSGEAGASAALDLKQVFGKKDEDEGTGLGVGGW